MSPLTGAARMQTPTMRRSFIVTALTALSLASCGEERQPRVEPPGKPPSAVAAPAKRAWFEGVFKGELELEEFGPPLYEKPTEKEKRKASGGRPLGKADISLEVMPSGEARLSLKEPSLTCLGQVEDEILRLRCDGPDASGTLIAKRGSDGFGGSLRAAPHDASKTWLGRATMRRAETSP